MIEPSKKIVVVLFVSILLSGCGKGTPMDKKIILRWSGYAYPGYDKFRADESKKFELLHPNVSVRYEPISGDYTTQILTQIAGGNPPDMFFVPQGTLKTFVQKGILMDLTPYVAKDKTFFKEIYPSLIEAQTDGGNIYALPGNLNTWVLFYNKELFDEAHLTYPTPDWSWDDMLSSAIKLTKKNPNGSIEQFGCVIPRDTFMLFIRQAGAEMWDNDKRKCIINSPEAVKAIEFVKNMFITYHVSPNIGELVQQGRREIFVAGRAAMYYGGTWDRAMMAQTANLNKIDWHMAPLPKGLKRYTEMGSLSLGISSSTKHPELTYELTKFMLRTESIMFLIKVGDSLPIRMIGEEVNFYLNFSAGEKDEKQAILDMVPYARGWSEIAHPKIPYPEQEEIFYRHIDEFMLGDSNLTAKEALDNIAQELNHRIQ